MEVELQFIMKIDGNVIATYSYKVEDGKDEPFMLLCQAAREKLNDKMLKLIELECQ